MSEFLHRRRPSPGRGGSQGKSLGSRRCHEETDPAPPQYTASEKAGGTAPERLDSQYPALARRDGPWQPNVATGTTARWSSMSGPRETRRSHRTLIATTGLEQVSDLGLELLLEGPRVGDAELAAKSTVPSTPAISCPPLTSVSWSMPKRVENSTSAPGTGRAGWIQSGVTRPPEPRILGSLEADELELRPVAMARSSASAACSCRCE